MHDGSVRHADAHEQARFYIFAKRWRTSLAARTGPQERRVPSDTSWSGQRATCLLAPSDHKQHRRHPRYRSGDHLNDPPGNITLNDDQPEHKKYATLYGEMAGLQASGVKILGMLGGAAKGSYDRLDDAEPDRLEAYYVPLRDLLREHNYNGLDLTIEKPMSLTG